MQSMLEAALEYARRGWRVFPCDWRQDDEAKAGEKRRKRAKSPLVGQDKDEHGKGIDGTGWKKKATADEAQIRAWWGRWPKALIAVPTGRNVGAFVVDLDPRGETVEDVEKRLVEAVGELPPCPRSRTQSGGLHLWFRLPFADDMPANNVGRIKGVDWRGEGGYVIVPPSIMSDGLFYEWIVDAAEFDFPAPPARLIDLVYKRGEFSAEARKAAAAPAGDKTVVPFPGDDRRGAWRVHSTDPGDQAVRRYARAALDRARNDVANAGQGARNHTLNACAFSMAAFVELDALSEREVVAALRDAADACGLTKDDGEAQRDATIKSGLSAGRKNAGTLKAKLDDVRRKAEQRAAKKAPPADGAPPAGSPPAGGEGAGSPGGPQQFYPPPPDDDAKIPITFLGYSDELLHFLMDTGDKRELTPRALKNDAEVEWLFAGHREFLCRHFPQVDDMGRPKPDKWSTAAVRRWIFGRAKKIGRFDPATPVRKQGIWRSGEGKLLIHVGDEVGVVTPEGIAYRRAGFLEGGALYPGTYKISRPTAPTAAAEDGQKLLKALRLWNWADEIGPDAVVGWFGQALLGVAKPWNAHAAVRNDRGSGKTWLVRLLAAAFGDQARHQIHNTSEAGLRQMVSSEARALLLDEQEDDAGSGGAEMIQRMLGIIRLMSSGDGRIVRGTTEGDAREFVVNGCAFMAAILLPDLKPQDRSRITVLRLLKLTKGADPELVVRATEWAKKMSGAFRLRALLGAERYLADFATWRTAVVVAGCDARYADQYASLLAGRDLLLRDEEITAGEAKKEIEERFADWIKVRLEEDAEQSEGAECLRRILYKATNIGSGQVLSPAGMIMAARKARETAAGPMMRRLQVYGLRLLTVDEVRATRGRFKDEEKKLSPALKAMLWAPGSEEPPGEVLLVARRHPELAKLLEGSRWEHNKWRDALEYLDGAAEWPATARIGGESTRCSAIPCSLLPVDDLPDVAKADPPPPPPERSGDPPPSGDA